MKKFALLSLFLLLAGGAAAQVVDDSSNLMMQKNKRVVSKQTDEPVVLTAKEPEISAKDKEVEAIIKSVEEKQPAEITPAQKSEITLKAKRSIRNNLRAQSVRQRRDFLTTLNVLDKKHKRQQALRDGKTEEEAKCEYRR